MNATQPPLLQALGATKAMGLAFRELVESIDAAVEMGQDMPGVMGSEEQAKAALEHLAHHTRGIAEGLWTDREFGSLEETEWRRLVFCLQAMARAAAPLRSLFAQNPSWFPEETRPALQAFIQSFEPYSLGEALRELEHLPMPAEGSNAQEGRNLMAAFEELRDWALRFCIVSVAMYSGPGEPEPGFLKNH